jgi:hypothetical protein
MRILSRIVIPNSAAAPNSNGTTSQEEALDATKSEESQATMESFLKKEAD